MFFNLDLLSRNQYEETLRCMLEMSDKCILVKRKRPFYSDQYNEVLNKLNKFLIIEEERFEWPGTSTRSAAIVFEYEVCEELIEILLDVSSNFRDWHIPNLPDDLCFLKADNEIITTIGHEDMGFIRTSDENEISILKDILIKK